MVTPNEIETTLHIIRNAWYHFPEMRLGQLLTNAAIASGMSHGDDLFYIPDEQLIDGINDIVKRFSK